VRNIVVSEFLTLDGVMQGPGDPNEDRSEGFEHGGWQLAYFDDTFANEMNAGFERTEAYLFGRRTYEIFAGWWPNQGPDDPLAPIFNEAPKYVVSTTLSEPLPWQNSTLIHGDVPAEIARLKAGAGKDIQVIGSGELVRTLIKHRLVDRYQLMIHPLVLGTGKRLFQGDLAPTRLRLVDSKPSSKGVLILTYEPAEAESETVAIPVAEGQTAPS
jgi:dihydrofolate reductase